MVPLEGNSTMRQVPHLNIFIDLPLEPQLLPVKLLPASQDIVRL